MSASLRPFTLLLMSAIPSGMLDHFEYDFDHKESAKGFHLAFPTQIAPCLLNGHQDL